MVFKLDFIGHDDLATVRYTNIIIEIIYRSLYFILLYLYCIYNYVSIHINIACMGN